MTNGRSFSLTGVTYYVESGDGMMYEVKEAPGQSAPRIRAKTYRTNRNGGHVTYWRKLKPNSRVAAQITSRLDALRGDAAAMVLAGTKPEDR